jgi:hypothetical protein
MSEHSSNRVVTYFELVLVALSLLVFVGPASSIELNLSGDQFWIVLGSRQDPDQAIAVARRFIRLKPLVVKTANGWLAVITGPNLVKKGERQKFIQTFAKENLTPSDGYLTKGASFKEVLWSTPASPVLASAEYDGERDVTFKSEDFEIKLSKRTINNEEAIATAKAIYKGKPAFEMEMPEDNPSEKPASAISLVRLDPNSPAPQVVFTYYWMGAHCCTVTKIATLGANGWSIIDGETLDGDGYWFEPSSDNSFSYLLKADNAFLYTFDSYAGSIAPTRIMKLTGIKIEDVTKQPQFYRRNLQDLYSIEDIAKGNDDDWHSNGYLAGWVAASALVGQGREAWTKMLASYDHDSDFGPEECSVDKKIGDCPEALEAFDSAIQKATCAVTYELNLRPVVGHLAENGEMYRARSLNVLIRRNGPELSHRIKYTVKPTSSGSYIEILP